MRIFAIIDVIGYFVNDASYWMIALSQAQNAFVCAVFSPGLYTHVKSNFIRTLSNQAIEAVANFARTSPSPFTFAVFFEHWHDAVDRVGVDL